MCFFFSLSFSFVLSPSSPVCLLLFLSPLFSILCSSPLYFSLFSALSKAEGEISYSSLSLSVFYKYYWFQLVNVFLVYTISGTVFHSLGLILDNPTSIVQILAATTPKGPNEGRREAEYDDDDDDDDEDKEEESRSEAKRRHQFSFPRSHPCYPSDLSSNCAKR